MFDGPFLQTSACLLLLLACGCPDPAPPAAVQTTEEGNAPQLLSWSGSTDCCGEDPHPVHGALLADGSVVMVGKAAAEGSLTSGFLTRWRAPDGPSTGRFVDDDGEVILQTLSLPTDSALLQVMEVDGVIVAVGFEAETGIAPARGLALAIDRDSLQIIARLHVVPSDQDRSSVLESIALAADGTLLLGGSSELDREQMEGFKSYGNVVGGSGLLAAVRLQDWLSKDTGTAAMDAEEAGALLLDIPEVHSLKSIKALPDGRILAIASDLDETSGMLRVEAGRSGYEWYPYNDQFELTDLAVVQHAGGTAIALVGHGGPDTIDGHAKLVETDGSILWSTTFGNPGLAAEETPAGGLASDAFIFDECWGVAVRGNQLVAACGSGIEGCGAIPASPAERQLCDSDPRRSWRSYLVGLSYDGEVMWSRAESFIDEEGEAAESAAEFVVTDETGTFYGIIDQNFGVGLARFGG